MSKIFNWKIGALMNLKSIPLFFKIFSKIILKSNDNLNIVQVGNKNSSSDYKNIVSNSEKDFERY